MIDTDEERFPGHQDASVIGWEFDALMAQVL